MGFSTAQMADEHVGFYRPVQTMARLSYQGIIAATFVIFPLISRTSFAEERETTKQYIRTTMRYSMIFAMAVATLFAANPEEMIGLIYASDFADAGGSALRVLAFGYVAFSIFVIAGTILNSAGMTREAIISAAVTLVLAAVSNWIVIPRFDPGPDLFVACAVATSVSMGIGAIIANIFLFQKLGAFCSIFTCIRVMIAAAASVWAGSFLTFEGKIMTLVETAIIGMVFLVVVVILREIGREDLSAVLHSLRGNRSANKSGE